jgi:hypothetical protein
MDLHRRGNEIAWWANVHLSPLEAAKSLWEATLFSEKNFTEFSRV